MNPGTEVVSTNPPAAGGAGPIRVLELRSVLGTGGGPEKTILLGTANSDPAAFQITVCYLRARDDVAYRLDGRARALGIRYEEIIERGSWDPAIWIQLVRLARATRAEIVHSHDHKTDLLAWLLRARLGVAALATAHGWTGHSRRERLFYYPIDKRVLARFPRVIAVSSQIKEELVRSGADPARVTVVLNGIDDKMFRRDVSRISKARERMSIPAGLLAVGTVGRLEPQKRFDILLKAFAQVRSVIPHTLLLIAGAGSQRTQLERLCNELNLGHSCRLLGQTDDVIGFHHALDLFVQSSDYEGTPNAILEAMALETPIAATRAGGTDELVRDRLDGVLVPCADVGRLAAAMIEVLADPGSATDRAHIARRRIETELSFDIRMRKVETEYHKLVDR